MNETKKNDTLIEKLKALSHSDDYPFHMPGHKRRGLPFPNPWSIDITEIDGFDDLHHPHGLIQNLQKRAAKLFGARESFCLVNGSTSGILAAISSCVSFGGTILMARNCHRSAYHAAYLRHLNPIYLTPEVLDFGILGGVNPSEVKAALEKYPNIEAVFVVSPTYDGVLSNIGAIGEIAHAYGIPLIVDEAHGSHLAFYKEILSPPVDALSLRADVVVHSLHKTLPAFTQSALLHIGSYDFIDREKIKSFLQIYQTSSPSYLLLASMEQCFDLLEGNGKELFQKFFESLEAFYSSCSTLKNLKLFRASDYSLKPVQFDFSKILVSTYNYGTDSGYASGQDFYTLLRETYHIQPEMANGTYVLFLSSIMDTEEGFQRLAQALQETDDRDYVMRRNECDVAKSNRIITEPQACQGEDRFIPSRTLTEPGISEPKACKSMGEISIRRQGEGRFTQLWEALDSPYEAVPIEDALGRINRDFLSLYPPGIPLLLPGERIEAEHLTLIRSLPDTGRRLEGLSESCRIKVISILGL